MKSAPHLDTVKPGMLRTGNDMREECGGGELKITLNRAGWEGWEQHFFCGPSACL